MTHLVLEQTYHAYGICENDIYGCPHLDLGKHLGGNVRGWQSSSTVTKDQTVPWNCAASREVFGRWAVWSLDCFQSGSEARHVQLGFLAILTEEIGNMGAIALILAVCVLGFGMSFSGAVVSFLVLVWLAIVSQS
jgi:hypothetical protein